MGASTGRTTSTTSIILDDRKKEVLTVKINAWIALLGFLAITIHRGHCP